MDSDPTLPSLLDAVSPQTDVRYADLALIGAAILTTVTTVQRMGWASPGSSLDYTNGLRDPHDLIVRDFIAWTSGRRSLAAGCDERLLAYVEQSGWTHHLLGQVDLFLTGNGGHRRD